VHLRTVPAVLMLSLLATLLPVTAAQSQVEEGASQSVAKYQKQARAVTNNKREAHDLVQLRYGKCVQRFAAKQARRMANQDRMFHQDLGPVMNRCHLNGAGENVAYGYPTGRKVVRAWMRSEGHRANILEPSYRILGMAMRRSDNGTPYAAQVFGRR
jgi:uncharacterized protein YkwD